MREKVNEDRHMFGLLLTWGKAKFFCQVGEKPIELLTENPAIVSENLPTFF